MAQKRNIFKFSRPARWWASGWREALVTGNGVVGCSVLGGAAEDSVMITHGDLWWHGSANILQDVSDTLPKVRSLIDEGKLKEAADVMPSALINKGFRPQLSYPLPLCDLKIKLKTDKPAKEYLRSVNLDSGEISVSFKDGATKYTRSLFVSRAEDLVVMEITRTGNKAIDADLKLELHDKINLRTPNAIISPPEGARSRAEGKFLFFSARGDKGLDFGAVAYVNFFGGSIAPQAAGPGADVISVRGAEKVFIVIKPFIGAKSHEVKWKEIRDELKLFKNTYEKLLKEQTSLAAKSFGRAYLDLSDEDSYADKLPVEANCTPEMLEKLWLYGRYLFVSGTGPSALPIAPYGIWCGDYKAPDSTMTADGSVQLMYEQAITGNLTDYCASLFSFYENVKDDLTKNAIRLFNAHGIMIPSVIARGTGLLGLTEPSAINFTGAAAWIGRLYYDCYRATGDTKLLKSKVLPFLKDAAQFYMEFFQLQSDTFYESSPSYSPGSDFASKNALIDFALARELFQNLIEGSSEAGVNKNEIPKWEQFLNRLPQYKAAPDGTLREYFDNRAPEAVKSGSTSIFYPVYPGGEINEASGEIYRQFEKTADKRFAFGQHQNAASLARYAGLFVRLGQPERAEEIIAALVRGMAMDNLIFSASDWTGMGAATTDAWATYTIEPNLLLTGAIQDMFVRSDGENVYLLPACAVAKGELGGFLTRTGVEVTEMQWDRKKGTLMVKLKAKKARKISIRLSDAIKKYKGPGTVEPDQKTIVNVELLAGKAVTLDIKI